MFWVLFLSVMCVSMCMSVFIFEGCVCLRVSVYCCSRFA